MATKGKSGTGRKTTATRKPAVRKTTARKAPVRKPAARASAKPAPSGGVGQSFVVDLIILVSLAMSLFVTLSVYWPDFAKPAGQVVHDYLYAWIGVGMYPAPAVLLLLPLVLLRTSLKPTFLKAWAWAWAITLLTSLLAGLREAGGVFGDSCASFGYGKINLFYPLLLVLIALLVIARLAGRTLIVPLIRGTYRAAVRTGEAVADIRDAVREEAEDLKAAREQRQAERAARDEDRERRRREIIAAELEAADAPEGDSPVIRNGGLDASPLIQDCTPDMEQLDEEIPAVKLLPNVELSVPDETPSADDFTAVVEAARPDGTELVELGLAEDYEQAAVSTSPGLEEQIGSMTDSVTEYRIDDDEHDDGEDEAEEGQLALFPSTQRGYELPPLTLLKDAPRISGEEVHLERRARIIETTLKSFNVTAQCVNTVVGPRVTRYELKIGPGINVSKIHGLADNLALELAVKAVRIEAPIPGLSAVGIEVPNASSQLVTLKSVLESPLNQRANHPLTIGLGRDIAGQPVIANLAKMPHLLVAGATGSGKSVCLNALIISLLMRNAPDTLRMILIDPKRVEMTNFTDVPHLACPVVHDVHMAQSALKWAVAEMERRYRMLEQARARNIAAYNESQPAERQLPYIVVIVDELADLMMLAGQVIEKLICRIAQLSRAVGIHLVIATQRPDVKVITGTIKANIPSRIAFATVSQIDSRTILDGGGADKLLGSGDMLFAPIGENVPLRVQGAFLADEEIDRVVVHCRQQADVRYDESITTYADDEQPGAPGGGDGRDELFSEARSIVQDSGRASTSYLQRRLKIGYNRAARIMEELEEGGIVSPPDHAGNRKVL